MCKFIVITNRKMCRGDFLEQIDLICRAGADRIILREKDLSETAYKKLAMKVLDVCRPYRTVCSLHSFINAAKELKAEAIHLPLPIAKREPAAAKYFKSLGISAHSLEEVRFAEQYRASYVTASHIFPTACKAGLLPRGIPFLKEICEKTALPVYALGGITPENLTEVLNTKAAGVCVMSWAMQASYEEMKTFADRVHRK